MPFQKQCPSCNKYTTIITVDGNTAEMHRCEHCGFQIRIPPKKYQLKSSDFGV